MLIQQKTITFGNVTEVAAEMQKAIGEGCCEFDFANVERVDSSAIALAVEILKFSEKSGVKLEIRNVPESFKKLGALYGFKRLY